MSSDRVTSHPGLPGSSWCLPASPVLQNGDHNRSYFMLCISLCDKELRQWLTLLSHLEHCWALPSPMGNAELMNEPFSINSPVCLGEETLLNGCGIPARARKHLQGVFHYCLRAIDPAVCSWCRRQTEELKDRMGRQRRFCWFCYLSFYMNAVNFTASLRDLPFPDYS